MSDAPTHSNDLSTPSGAEAAAPLLSEMRQLIQAAREWVAVAVNSELTLLYWRIGKRLRTEVLQEQRAEYGRQIVEIVASDLMARFGKGFERTNLFRMIRFAEAFPDEPIVATVSPQLARRTSWKSWSSKMTWRASSTSRWAATSPLSPESAKSW